MSDPGKVAGELLVDAHGIVVSGPWGRVSGPLDLVIPSGGVNVVEAPPGAARSAPLMALCGRPRQYTMERLYPSIEA